jgi:hypothetical protein
MSTRQTARSKPIIDGLIDSPDEQIILVGRSLHRMHGGSAIFRFHSKDASAVCRLRWTTRLLVES